MFKAKHVQQAGWQKGQPAPCRKKNEFYNKLFDAAAEKQIKLLEKKAKILKKIGIDEKKIVEKIGVEKSFEWAKASSKFDIFLERLNIIASSVYSLSAAAFGAYMSFKLSSEIQGLDPEKLSGFYLQRSFQYISSLEKVVLPAIAISATINAVLKKVGNYLDIFQHLFIAHIVSNFDEKIKPAAYEIYKKFSAASLKEVAVDIALSYVPLPFLDIYARFKMIKYEKEQLKAIEGIKQLYLSEKEGASQPKP
ncbi:MAG: hypothetical protein N3G22_04790 [Candidatus Micrarchaeota archaeon]|nr:hypothetical protein [Candidatus Micrarchaeota archaeon]